MNTRKKSGNRLFPILFLLALVFQQCNNTERENHLHQANRDIADKEHIEQVTVPPNKQVLSRQSTVKLSPKIKTQILKTQGYIGLNGTRNESVSAKFGGRIEKLFVKYNLQYVKKGDRILELYSSELNTFQEQHLFLLKSVGEKALLEQSRQKLRLLGITDDQLSQLEEKGKSEQTITVYSPANGYVLFTEETKSGADVDASKQATMSEMSMEANNIFEKNAGLSARQIREGAYVNKGETLFSINDLQTIWAIVSISADAYSFLNINNPVKIISELFPNKQLSGKVVLVEQTFEESKQRFVRLRIELPNRKGQLKLNSFITAEIPLETKGDFQIPASAVYRTGLNSYVWVKLGRSQSGTGIFQLRKVTTGLPAKESSSVTTRMITVINGLSTNEEVAENAGYITDSETFINEN